MSVTNSNQKIMIKGLSKIVFLLAILTFISCGDDTDCAQSDWVGTYTGTVDCDGVTEDVTVNITASGAEDIVIQYETITMTTEYNPFTPENCSLNFSASAGGISTSISATLDGDDLTINESISLGGSTSNCNVSASR